MARARISNAKLTDLEKRIGYAFSGHKQLIMALTHASATRRVEDLSHYERLEFVGDRVLGLCVSEMLFETFPKAREGELSARLNALVSGNTCADVADEIGLHDFIAAGSDVKQLRGKRMKSVRADVVESLIAAIYLDGGLEAARAFVDRYWRERLHHAEAKNRDSKTALQEWAHAHGHQTPVYEVKEQSGPDHAPVFTVEVVVTGTDGAIGKGNSKRSAEQDAAQSSCDSVPLRNTLAIPPTT